MKSPYQIIIAPHITERTVALSYGNPGIKNEDEIVRKYTFLVDPSANKIEIKNAIEAIYNEGRKEGDKIKVSSVHTIRMPGKAQRVRTKSSAQPKPGRTSDRKKAIVTLAKGQILEDFGV